MGIELSQPERNLLRELLQAELEEVRTELHHTRAFDYKESLKEREALVRGLLARMSA